MATVTIRDLGEEVKRHLRIQGARNGRSMEAEARAILTQGVLGPTGQNVTYPTAEADGPYDHLVGKWKGRITTDKLMGLTRGED